MTLTCTFTGTSVSTLYPVLLDRAMDTLKDACGSRLFPVNLSLTCHCLTPPGRSVYPLAYLKINCTAFPNQMVGRHLHCFRTLRSMNVRCTSRGHNQHSPKGLQPANSLAGLSCTIPISIGITDIVSEASPSRLLY